MTRYGIAIALAIAGCVVAGAQPRKELELNKPLPGYIIDLLPARESKPLIIDLFNSQCVVCFRMMPKVDSFNRLFSGQLDFLFIGKEDGLVRGIYERVQKKFDINVPVVFDSLLFTRTKIEFVPLYLWVDGQNVLRSVTGPDQLTHENLLAFANAGIVPPKVSKVKFDPSRPLLVDGNGGSDTSFLFRSVLATWMPDQNRILPARIGYFGRSSMFQVLGVSAAQLYLYAYLGKERWFYGDSLYGRYNPKVKMEVQQNDLYCYSISIRDRSEEALSMALKQDLDLYFGYRISWRTDTVQAWKLQIDSFWLEKLRTKGGRVIARRTDCGLEFRNVSLDQVLGQIQRMACPEGIILNETGISTLIDLHLCADTESWEELLPELTRKGLRFVEESRIIRTMHLSPRRENIAAN